MRIFRPYIYNMSRDRKNANKITSAPKFYLQPEQVLQFPEHFFVGLPVEEYISPE